MEYLGIPFSVKNTPCLQPDFLPFAPWRTAYLSQARQPFRIAVEGSGTVVHETRIRGGSPADLRYLERTIKLLLWSVGGWRVTLQGDEVLISRLRESFSPHGSRAFDVAMMETVYGRPFCVETAGERFPEPRPAARPIGGHLEGCRIGFDAGVCQEVLATPLKKIFNRLGLGKLIYLFIALKQLIFINPGKMTVTLDGENTFSYDHVYFTAVMNQKYEGGGFKFCPDAQPDDQLLDVILVEGIRKIKLLFCLPTAFFGKHVGIRGIHILTCSDIHVHSASALPIHIDGESGGIREDLTVSIEKSSLKIILPVV